MENVTEFTLIRHGQTADNVAGILQGHRDTPLDDMGRRQAQSAAERLRGSHFDAIFSSDLRRAFETAEIIGKAVGVTPVPTRELREWYLGELEGQYSKDLWVKYFDIMECFNVDSGDLPVPGGESHGAFERRIAQCLDDLADQWIGKSIIIVTHAGSMRAVFKHIVGAVAPGNMLPICSNVSYSSFFRYADGRWRLRCWNDISHLEYCRDSVTY